MAAKIVLSDNDMLAMAELIAKGENSHIIRKKFGLGENKFYVLRKELFNTGKIRKDEMGKLHAAKVYGDNRVMQTQEGAKRTIHFGDEWKPGKGVACTRGIGARSGLGLTMPQSE